MTDAVIERLRRAVGGRLVTPQDPGYDTERATFNATVQRRPVIIVRAWSDEDVRAAVLAANDLDLPTYVGPAAFMNLPAGTLENGSLICVGRTNEQLQTTVNGNPERAV